MTLRRRKKTSAVPMGQVEVRGRQQAIQIYQVA
jgi:hypothetical protein